MNKAWILAGLACGLVGTFVGCDTSAGTGASSTNSGASASVAGRTAFDTATVQVVDSSGDTVARGHVGKGVFLVPLPDGTRFPILITADSAGIKLRALVPSADSGRVDVEISVLTDSAAKSLGAYAKPPRGLHPFEWRGRLDDLRGKLDSLPPRRVRDSGGVADSTRDSLCKADSTKCPPPPPARLRRPHRDSCLTDSTGKVACDTSKIDSLRCPPRDTGIVPDSLRRPPMGGRLHGRPGEWHPIPKDSTKVDSTL